MGTKTPPQHPSYKFYHFQLSGFFFAVMKKVKMAPHFFGVGGCGVGWV
jgi:hypothetical protein